MADNDGRATNWLHKERSQIVVSQSRKRRIAYAFSQNFFVFSDLQKKDLDRDILKPLIIQRELSVYDSPEYIKDMGTRTGTIL